MEHVHLITQCRGCSGNDLVEILDLGHVPLSDGFVKSLDEPQPHFPLTLVFCQDCTLTQLKETVAPEVLFNADYPYYSSYSTSWLEHCEQNAAELIDRFQLNENSLVVELASNDGYMLKNFHQQGVPVLGIDPAPGPAKVAHEKGIETRIEFFSKRLASELSGESLNADLIIANNVLAHVADTHDFIDGICKLLKPSGTVVIEVPYLRTMIENLQFDTIYHEHLCYFSVRSICELFGRHGCSVIDVAKLHTHGGSIRLFIQNNAEQGESTSRILAEEQEMKMDDVSWYNSFAESVQGTQQSLLDTIDGLRKKGKTIAAYGAAAKGTILLNTAKLERHHIDFAVDRNVYKQGQFIPGINVPIYSTEKILEEQPDYLLILPWNLKEEIIKQERVYQQRGGCFIIPIPEVEFV